MEYKHFLKPATIKHVTTHTCVIRVWRSCVIPAARAKLTVYIRGRVIKKIAHNHILSTELFSQADLSFRSLFYRMPLYPLSYIKRRVSSNKTRHDKLYWDEFDYWDFMSFEFTCSDFDVLNFELHIK